MKYIDEYRDQAVVEKLVDKIKSVTTRDWNLMEICGGQTHAIVKFGLDQLLPPTLHLIHGPGCPVCVTPLEMIDKALQIAAQPDVIFCSFGDMMRVPGSQKDLFAVKSEGADVRIVYSPLDAVKLAEAHPDKKVVFFAVGFETTAPANALAVFTAKQKNVSNFSILVSHVLVPPAMEAILSSPTNKVQGFLAAGHVCTIMGFEEYYPIAQKYKVPIIVTGFEPVDILEGILLCVQQLERGTHRVENQYARSVTRQGNRPAQDMVAQLFTVIPRKWRGIGEIPHSGLGLKKEFAMFDAEKIFSVESIQVQESDECKSGLVLRGELNPMDCPAFGTKCTPDNPLGAPMVSSEGACAAYYRYGRTKKVEVNLT